jgi:hypothetical protein
MITWRERTLIAAIMSLPILIAMTAIYLGNF